MPSKWTRTPKAIDGNFVPRQAQRGQGAREFRPTPRVTVRISQFLEDEMAATSKRKTLPAGKVRVKILPKDPLVARRDGLWPVEITLDCPTPETGPSGPHAVVVDYNADLDTRFAPAVLQANRSFRGMAHVSGAKLLDDFHFHQVNMWSIVERTLALIEDEYLMGRPIPWAFGSGRLILLPHAGYLENAFYDRDTGALHFFYFQGPDGKPVYTCLSHDVVAHELGHAILDGLKPHYNEVSSPETAGFHEYFGDAVAMMASLSTRETALVVVRGGPARLEPRNVVSAIASEFGAALRGIPDEDYLRGAWNNRKMKDLRGTFEEHDWSEILTGVYYDVLEWLYPRFREDAETKGGRATTRGKREQYSMQALSRAATVTAGVMFRALDYCPPVDLRYDEYACAMLRADEVAYPLDDLGIRRMLLGVFKRRGLLPTQRNPAFARDVQMKLRSIDIGQVASPPADAYRFLDSRRNLFGIPYEANLSIISVYRTNKHAKSGYRPPKEHVIEFVWSEDVKLSGRRFRSLSGTTMPLLCGGTLVFDSIGNFLHMSLVGPTDRRHKELQDYAAYLVKSGSLAVTDGLKGIGAPGPGLARLAASIDGGRVTMVRNPAMRHAASGEHA